MNPHIRIHHLCKNLKLPGAYLLYEMTVMNHFEVEKKSHRTYPLVWACAEPLGAAKAVPG